MLITGLQGYEEISHLFDFQVTLVADLTTEVHFDGIIGQNVTVEMSQVDGTKRYFNGLVKRFSQGERDENFLHFRAQVVPKVWLLTKKVRSRIFQHLSVPDILKQVFTGFDVNYDITGTYYPRDFCVQYRESDFDFANRLMEEEGIYYFFNHTDGNHPMTVSDNTNKHPFVPGTPRQSTKKPPRECGRICAYRLGENAGNPRRRMHPLGPLLRGSHEPPGSQGKNHRQRPGGQSDA